MRLHHIRRWAAAGLALCLAATLAHADYPDRPLRLVVPFPPGGNIDATARIVAAGLQKSLGQTVVVDNKPGAGGMIGAESVARAAPDGYTLLLGSTGAFATARALNPDLKLDPVRDFESASPIARAPLLLVVNPALPVQNVAELIAYAKARPGKLTVASSGTGTAAHLTAELFQSASGAKLLHVAYKGSGPAITDLIGGQVDLSFDQPASTLAQVKAGKLRALGVTTNTRSSVAPQLPTVAESGLTGFESSTTTGLMLPASTPAAVLNRLNSAMRDVLQQADTRQRFEAMGSDVMTGSGSDFDRLMAQEIQKWTKVVKDADVKVP